jgi:3'-phosphoadenosine 5'-phosphosulfate sulfotransferase (PAPS reductase)/FAD synthetase
MQRDPFHIEGPAIISFSGGRTSAYMLWRILQAHSGTLPSDVKVCFANTGKEMLQTLNFVKDCGEHWGVEIVWLEYGRGCVTYETASRAGEPYTALINKKAYLPNPVTRFCTIELKILPARDFARSMGWDAWTVVLGMRADEPRRVARSRNNGEAWDNICPLADAGVMKRDVAAFWGAQNFDLRLPNINGATPAGNCDLCFLKGSATITGIMRDHPELANWWIKAEAEARASKPSGARFRVDRPSYAQMFDAVQRQQNMNFGDIDQRIDCFCSEDQ